VNSFYNNIEYINLKDIFNEQGAERNGVLGYWVAESALFSISHFPKPMETNSEVYRFQH